MGQQHPIPSLIRAKKDFLREVSKSKLRNEAPAPEAPALEAPALETPALETPALDLEKITALKPEVRKKLLPYIAPYFLKKNKKDSNGKLPPFFLVFLIMIVFMLLFNDFMQNLINKANNFNGFISPFLSLLLYIIFCLIDIFISYFINELFRNVSPKIFRNTFQLKDVISSIVYNLVTIMLIDEEKGDYWTETENREEQLVLLEKTAKIIENDLPRGLYGGDTATDVWVKETMRQVAAALREKKKMLLTPKSDTRDSFIMDIASILTCIADGNWGEVERIELPRATRTQLRYSFSKFVLRLLRTLIIGAVPVVGLVVLQQTSFALQGATFASTVGILFIYEISVFTSVLDPSFGDRIANVKDIKDLVSSPEVKPKL